MPALLLNASYFLGEHFHAHLTTVQFINIHEPSRSFSRSSPVMSSTFISPPNRKKGTKEKFPNQTLILLGSFVRTWDKYLTKLGLKEIGTTYRLPVITGKTSLDLASIILNATFFKSEMPTAMSSSIPISSPTQGKRSIVTNILFKENVIWYYISLLGFVLAF